jgi:hypothetical protein
MAILARLRIIWASGSDASVLFRANFRPIDGPEILRQEKMGGDAVPPHWRHVARE